MTDPKCSLLALLLCICFIAKFGLSCGNINYNYDNYPCWSRSQIPLDPWSQKYLTNAIPQLQATRTLQLCPSFAQEKGTMKDKRFEIRRQLSNCFSNVESTKKIVQACLAGYDNQIYKIIDDIKHTTGYEVEVQFYLFGKCKFSLIERYTTTIHALQDVLTNYNHYICLNKDYVDKYDENEECGYIEKLMKIPTCPCKLPNEMRIKDFSQICICKNKEFDQCTGTNRVKDIYKIDESENKYGCDLCHMNGITNQNDYSVRPNENYSPYSTSQNTPCVSQSPNYWKSNNIPTTTGKISLLPSEYRQIASGSVPHRPWIPSYAIRPGGIPLNLLGPTTSIPSYLPSISIPYLPSYTNKPVASLPLTIPQNSNDAAYETLRLKYLPSPSYANNPNIQVPLRLPEYTLRDTPSYTNNPDAKISQKAPQYYQKPCTTLRSIKLPSNTNMPATTGPLLYPDNTKSNGRTPNLRSVPSYIIRPYDIPSYNDKPLTIPLQPCSTLGPSYSQPTLICPPTTVPLVSSPVPWYTMRPLALKHYQNPGDVSPLGFTSVPPCTNNPDLAIPLQLPQNRQNPWLLTPRLASLPLNTKMLYAKIPLASPQDLKNPEDTTIGLTSPLLCTNNADKNVPIESLPYSTLPPTYSPSNTICSGSNVPLALTSPSPVTERLTLSPFCLRAPQYYKRQLANPSTTPRPTFSPQTTILPDTTTPLVPQEYFKKPIDSATGILPSLSCTKIPHATLEHASPNPCAIAFPHIPLHSNIPNASTVCNKPKVTIPFVSHYLSPIAEGLTCPPRLALPRYCETPQVITSKPILKVKPLNTIELDTTALPATPVYSKEPSSKTPIHTQTPWFTMRPPAFKYYQNPGGVSPLGLTSLPACTNNPDLAIPLQLPKTRQNPWVLTPRIASSPLNTKMLNAKIPLASPQDLKNSEDTTMGLISPLLCTNNADKSILPPSTLPTTYSPSNTICSDSLVPCPLPGLGPVTEGLRPPPFCLRAPQYYQKQFAYPSNPYSTLRPTCSPQTMIWPDTTTPLVPQEYFKKPIDSATGILPSLSCTKIPHATLEHASPNPCAIAFPHIPLHSNIPNASTVCNKPKVTIPFVSHYLSPIAEGLTCPPRLALPRYCETPQVITSKPILKVKPLNTIELDTTALPATPVYSKEPSSKTPIHTQTPWFTMRPPAFKYYQNPGGVSPLGLTSLPACTNNPDLAIPLQLPKTRQNPWVLTPRIASSPLNTKMLNAKIPLASPQDLKNSEDTTMGLISPLLCTNNADKSILPPSTLPTTYSPSNTICSDSLVPCPLPGLGPVTEGLRPPPFCLRAPQYYQKQFAYPSNPYSTLRPTCSPQTMIWPDTTIPLASREYFQRPSGPAVGLLSPLLYTKMPHTILDHTSPNPCGMGFPHIPSYPITPGASTVQPISLPSNNNKPKVTIPCVSPILSPVTNGLKSLLSLASPKCYETLDALRLKPVLKGEPLNTVTPSTTVPLSSQGYFQKPGGFLPDYTSIPSNSITRNGIIPLAVQQNPCVPSKPMCFPSNAITIPISSPEPGATTMKPLGTLSNANKKILRIPISLPKFCQWPNSLNKCTTSSLPNTNNAYVNIPFLPPQNPLKRLTTFRPTNSPSSTMRPDKSVPLALPVYSQNVQPLTEKLTSPNLFASSNPDATTLGRVYMPFCNNNGNVRIPLALPQCYWSPNAKPLKPMSSNSIKLDTPMPFLSPDCSQRPRALPQSQTPLPLYTKEKPIEFIPVRTQHNYQNPKKSALPLCVYRPDVTIPLALPNPSCFNVGLRPSVFNTNNNELKKPLVLSDYYQRQAFTKRPLSLLSRTNNPDVILPNVYPQCYQNLDNTPAGLPSFPSYAYNSYKRPSIATPIFVSLAKRLPFSSSLLASPQYYKKQHALPLSLISTLPNTFRPDTAVPHLPLNYFQRPCHTTRLIGMTTAPSPALEQYVNNYNNNKENQDFTLPFVSPRQGTTAMKPFCLPRNFNNKIIPVSSPIYCQNPSSSTVGLTASPSYKPNIKIPLSSPHYYGGPYATLGPLLSPSSYLKPDVTVPLTLPEYFKRRNSQIPFAPSNTNDKTMGNHHIPSCTKNICVKTPSGLPKYYLTPHLSCLEPKCTTPLLCKSLPLPTEKSNFRIPLDLSNLSPVNSGSTSPYLCTHNVPKYYQNPCASTVGLSSPSYTNNPDVTMPCTLPSVNAIIGGLTSPPPNINKPTLVTPTFYQNPSSLVPGLPSSPSYTNKPNYLPLSSPEYYKTPYCSPLKKISKLSDRQSYINKADIKKIPLSSQHYQNANPIPQYCTCLDVTNKKPTFNPSYPKNPFIKTPPVSPCFCHRSSPTLKHKFSQPCTDNPDTRLLQASPQYWQRPNLPFSSSLNTFSPDGRVPLLSPMLNAIKPGTIPLPCVCNYQDTKAITPKPTQTSSLYSQNPLRLTKTAGLNSMTSNAPCVPSGSNHGIPYFQQPEAFSPDLISKYTQRLNTGKSNFKPKNQLDQIPIPQLNPALIMSQTKSSDNSSLNKISRYNLTNKRPCYTTSNVEISNLNSRPPFVIPNYPCMPVKQLTTSNQPMGPCKPVFNLKNGPSGFRSLLPCLSGAETPCHYLNPCLNPCSIPDSSSTNKYPGFCFNPFLKNIGSNKINPFNTNPYTCVSPCLNDFSNHGLYPSLPFRNTPGFDKIQPYERHTPPAYDICKKLQQNKIINVSNMEIDTLLQSVKNCITKNVLKSNQHPCVSSGDITIATPVAKCQVPEFCQKIDNDIEIKRFNQKVKVLKYKLEIDPVEIDVPCYVPVVKCNERRDPKCIQQLVENFVKNIHHCNPIALNGIFDKGNQFVLMKNANISESNPLIWPAVCKNFDTYIKSGSCIC